MRVRLVVTTAISAAAKNEVQRIKTAMKRKSSHIAIVAGNQCGASGSGHGIMEKKSSTILGH